MTPAEELAAAAGKLEALATGASDGPWQVEGLKDTPVSNEITWYLDGIERWRGLTNSVHLGEDEGTARYIAAMNPLVGKALRSLLLYEAAMCGPSGRGTSDSALALARLINGCKCAYPDDSDPAAHIGCPSHGGAQ